MFLDFLGIGEGVFKLLILLVAGIYKLVSGVYQIFLVLAKTNLFGQETYAHLTDKVYIILAVVMLFVVAYTFITLIVDPDKNKGGKAVEDLIKKTVTSLILIVLCPTLFTFAFDLQDAILDQDIIGKFFTTSNTGYDGQKSIKEGGNLMAGTTFAAFFYPAHSQTEATEVTNKSSIGTLTSGSYKITCESGGITNWSPDKCTLQDAIDYATHTGEFKVFTAFAKNWLEDDDVKTGIDFSFLMALIAGGYLVFVIISFCFDLAVRVVKLAFYQIIAPICIACRIIPNKDSIFKNWWKAVCKTYLAVFIRVFIMNLAVFLMTELTQTDFWGSLCNPSEFECSGVVKFLAYAFLIMGLLTFVKQSTKLIDEIFGLGDVKLGIADKLREGGGFAAGAAIGAGVTATAQNISKTRGAFKEAHGGKEKFKALLKGTGQTVTGAFAGTYGGAKAAWNAKSYSEMKRVAIDQGEQVIKNELGREDDKKRYEASGNNWFTRTYIGGKILDKGEDIRDWATGHELIFDAKIRQGKEFKQFMDEFNGSIDVSVKKNLTNEGLITGDGEAQSFKGTEEARRAQESIFDEMSAMGIRTLGQWETYREQFKENAPKRENFADDEAFQAAQIEHSRRASYIDSIITQEQKNVRQRIADLVLQCETDEDFRRLQATHNITISDAKAIKANALNFVDAYNAAGAHVTDNDGKSYGPIDKNNMSYKPIKSVADSYEHIGQEAQSDKFKFEKNKEKRKSNQNSK